RLVAESRLLPGDRSGTRHGIKKMTQDRLEVDTDDAGTIGIEWDKVIRVMTTRVFEIEMGSGQIVVGVAPSPADLRVAVTDSDGVTTTHDLLSIVLISPIGRS